MASPQNVARDMERIFGARRPPGYDGVVADRRLPVPYARRRMWLSRLRAAVADNAGTLAAGGTLSAAAIALAAVGLHRDRAPSPPAPALHPPAVLIDRDLARPAGTRKETATGRRAHVRHAAVRPGHVETRMATDDDRKRTAAAELAREYAEDAAITRRLNDAALRRLSAASTAR